MKKYFSVLLLAVALTAGAVGCSSGAGEGEGTTVAGTEKPDGVDDAIYTYGVKALEVVDKYLDAEIEKGETFEILSGMAERVGDSNDTGIESYIRILYMEFDIEEDETLNIEEIKIDRDNLAGVLGQELRYRETALLEFDITGDEFIKMLNTILTEIEPTLVLGEFEKEEMQEGVIKEFSYALTTDKNIFVRYVVNAETNNVLYFIVSIDTDKMEESSFLDVQTYVVVGSLALGLEGGVEKMEEHLHLTDFVTKSLFTYTADDAEYTKYFSDSMYSFTVTPK